MHLVVRQAAAGKLALARLRCRHGVGLVRSVPVLSARRRPDRRVGLAGHARDLRRSPAADRPARLRDRHPRSDAAQTSVRSLRQDESQTSVRSLRQDDRRQAQAVRARPKPRRARRRSRPTSRRWPRPSATAPTSCWCSASSPAASSSASSPCTCPSYLIDRGLSAEVGGWTLGVIGLFNIVGAMLSGWLGGRMPKRYILAVHLLRARAGGDLPHHPAREPGGGADLRRRDRPALAVIGAADLRPGRRDVRHALARHAVRHRLLQPPGRRLPRRLSRRPVVSSTPARTTSCGGSACCSACCPPSSICRSSRSRWRGSRWRPPSVAHLTFLSVLAASPMMFAKEAPHDDRHHYRL